MSSIDEMSKIIFVESSNDIDELCINIDENNNSFKHKIKDILAIIGYPLTIVCEYNYVDKVFRDSYYNYFSSKHLEIEKIVKDCLFLTWKYNRKSFMIII